MDEAWFELAVLKLFYVDGIRHSAVVLARDEKEAVQLASEASREEKADPRVLYGYVGDWEVPGAHELILPKGYRLVTEKGLDRELAEIIVKKSKLAEKKSLRIGKVVKRRLRKFYENQRRDVMVDKETGKIASQKIKGIIGRMRVDIEEIDGAV